MASLTYLAGLFDGEGSVTISLRQRPGRSPMHQVQVNVTIASADALQGFKERWGGSICAWKKMKYVDRMIWAYSNSGAKAATMLAELRPHLIVKRPQAELAIAFQKARGDHRGRKRGFAYGTPPEAIAMREEYRQRMWALNGTRPTRHNRRPLET